MAPAQADKGIPAYTPVDCTLPSAAPAGAYLGRATVDLGTFKLGAPPAAVLAYNTQWGYPTSGVYGPGEIACGPADMLVPFNSYPDPASPGAYQVLGLLVMPIRTGSFSWLVKYYENAAQTIPVYLAFTATVNPAS